MNDIDYDEDEKAIIESLRSTGPRKETHNLKEDHHDHEHQKPEKGMNSAHKYLKTE